MSMTKKILLLFATIIPILYFIAFLVSAALLVFRVEESKTMFGAFQYFFLVHILMMFWGMALIAFYLVYLFKKSGLQHVRDHFKVNNFGQLPQVIAFGEVS